MNHESGQTCSSRYGAHTCCRGRSCLQHLCLGLASGGSTSCGCHMMQQPPCKHQLCRIQTRPYTCWLTVSGCAADSRLRDRPGHHDCRHPWGSGCSAQGTPGETLGGTRGIASGCSTPPWGSPQYERPWFRMARNCSEPPSQCSLLGHLLWLLQWSMTPHRYKACCATTYSRW